MVSETDSGTAIAMSGRAATSNIQDPCKKWHSSFRCHVWSPVARSGRWSPGSRDDHGGPKLLPVSHSGSPCGLVQLRGASVADQCATH